jgi:uncharacterized membrane protein
MKATIGVYDTHQKALEAVKELQNAGYPAKQLSIMGKADKVDNEMSIQSTASKVSKAEVSIGMIAGSVVGLLTGIGIFAIPGLGFLYGAGAVVGIFAGVDFGLMSGGLVAILTTLGIDLEHLEDYKKHIEDGKFLLLAQGSETAILMAENVLHKHGTHLTLDVHGLEEKTKKAA